MKNLVLVLIAGFISTHGVAYAQQGALRFGTIAGIKYCEAREQGQPHSVALQVALLDGTTANASYAVRQGSTENVNAQINFNRYIKSNCPQYQQDFTKEGVKSSTADMTTVPSCLSSVDIYNGVQSGVISKRCLEGGSIYIKVHR